MTEDELKEAFKRWWIAENEFWPAGLVELRVELDGSQVTITQLPSERSPLCKDVFSRQNFDRHAKVSTVMMGRCINQLKYQLEDWSRDIYWDQITMDRFFLLYKDKATLRRTPNLGRDAVDAIISVLRGSGLNRYSW